MHTTRRRSIDVPLVQRARIEFARTPDGWDLALHHYPSKHAGRPPVILCSGYSCNRLFIDFDDRYSLARFLARRGFDAWVIEFRGHGFSESAGSKRNRGWTFDELVELDVPAAIAYVREQSGGARPVWIGHSMGGMVAYAALGHIRALDESLAGLVTIASPVAFPRVASWMMRVLGQMLMALPFPQHLPQHNVLVALWWMLGRSTRVAVGMNPRNVDYRAFGQVLRQSICNVPRSMLRQVAQWSLTGEFQSVDKKVDYRANLTRIRTPTLVVAGAVDYLATPEMVRFAYEHISSRQKRYREFGTRQGDSVDYGHVDLIFGRRAPEEVFPTISAWLEAELVR